MGHMLVINLLKNAIFLLKKKWIKMELDWNMPHCMNYLAHIVCSNSRL
jgi:hypothetical protein